MELDKKKKIILSIGAAVAALLVIYFGLSIYFMSHFYFGTTINGVAVWGRSVESAKDTMQDAMDNYELTVKERDGSTDVISGNDIDMVVAWDGEIDTFLEKQNGFAWVIKLFKPDRHVSPMDISYNESKLTNEINNLSCFKKENQIQPQNAGISEYSAENGYELVPAVQGTIINKDAVKTNVKSYILGFKTELDLNAAQCYVLPEINDDDERLLAAIDQLNKALDTVITYQVGESTQVLDASTFQPWLYVDEDLNVCVDDEKLTEYVKGLASTYNTCYTARTFMTSYGTEVTIGNSHYGWKVDNDGEKAAIIADIMNGQAITRDLTYSMTANSHEGNDYGNSYVEINLTAQHLFLYVDGELVLESDFVSGDVSKEYNTPTGVFGLTYKEKDATLNGANYSTPVDYWMPFNGNIGMHDATWRGSFGAAIYKRNGSHGCINLPWSKAKEIYEYVDTGFPVLVYELPGTQSALANAMDQGYAVYDAIKEIGEVSLESEATIVAIRTQYDALSDTAKAYVGNYQVLLDAEAALANLKASVPQ